MHRLPLLFLLLLPGSNQTFATEPWLDKNALTTMVSGKTAHCKHLNRPSSGRTYFAPNGTMHGIRRGEPRKGRWYVKGNTLCTNWGNRPVCSRYQGDGEGGHYKFTLKGKRIVHIYQWHKGDQVYHNTISGVPNE